MKLVTSCQRIALIFALLLIAPAIAQPQSRPQRTIPLPPDCQAPLRGLSVYNEGQRLGFQTFTSFCRVDLATGRVKVFRTQDRIDRFQPAPSGTRVAVVLGDRVEVLNDEMRVESSHTFKFQGFPEVYWSSGATHVVVVEEFETGGGNMFAVVDLATKRVKTVRLEHDEADFEFDKKTDTLHAIQKVGKQQIDFVYDLSGSCISRQRTDGWQHPWIESATGKYGYQFKYEVGDGDTLIRDGSRTGPVVFKMLEHTVTGKLDGALWDNPTWNPKKDDLILALYLPGKEEVPEGLREIDVFSVTEKRILQRFRFRKDPPSYGWSGDGQQVILCEKACEFYPVQ